MTTSSPRYAPALIVLFALTALPIWFHALAQPREDDCADPAAFFAARRIGKAQVIKPGPMIRRFDGIEARLAGESVSIRVARTYDPSAFMASPLSLAFLPQLYTQPDEIRRLESEGVTLPVHWRELVTPAEFVVEAYLYVHAGRPTLHPMISSIPHTAQQLVSGPTPLTVLIASAQGLPHRKPSLEREAEALLVQAWNQLREACYR